MLRPGPYICAEFEMGGLPRFSMTHTTFQSLILSWLLHNGPMWIRTLYQPFINPALAYRNEVISRIKDLQFYTENGERGGPIIMVQVESIKPWTITINFLTGWEWTWSVWVWELPQGQGVHECNKRCSVEFRRWVFSFHFWWNPPIRRVGKLERWLMHMCKD